MIADAKLTIIYMNPAARQLLSGAEAELRKELPRFDIDTVIGSNMDIFFKEAGKQRVFLSRLQQPHQATIAIGRVSFDVLITPLLEGKRTSGFVIEWADAKARMLNASNAAQMAASTRFQPMLELKADGSVINANDNFLHLMGSSPDEIEGRHHSIFVNPAYCHSPAYKQFWERLAGGAYQASPFPRIAKGGKSVGIQGARDPIADAEITMLSKSRST